MKKYLSIILTACLTAMFFLGCGTQAITDDSDEDISDASIDMNGYLVTINTDGMGQVARVEEGKTLKFDDEYPVQSTVDHLKDGTVLVIGAKTSYDGWYFVKWTLNGEDYSTDNQITYTVTEDSDFIAVFDIEGDSDTGDESTEGADASTLPVYVYDGDVDTAAICDYLVEEIAPVYLEGQVSIPYMIIIGKDDGDSEDVLVWGDYWIMNYDLNGDTLKTVSGGNHPGLMHLQKNDDDTFTVTSFDQTTDGAGFDESAKEIFGDKYEDFTKVQGDDEAQEKARVEYIRGYVEANDLEIIAYQDFGWDPVDLY